MTEATYIAPAKVNLYLHVTGRREDGYHELDSLVTFADKGDLVTLTPARYFRLEFKGPFAGDVPPQDNTITHAARLVRERTGRPVHFHVTVHKNLPAGSGLGGGSADAAAFLWGMCEYYGLSCKLDVVQDMLVQIGADVPSCFKCAPSRIFGIGEKLLPAPQMPEIPAVLVYPGAPSYSGDVFRHLPKAAWSGPLRPKDDAAWPKKFESARDVIGFLSERTNDLQATAAQRQPAIRKALQIGQELSNPGLIRMSGSGSSVFILYETDRDAQTAAKILKSAHSSWWVSAVTLNRPARY